MDAEALFDEEAGGAHASELYEPGGVAERVTPEDAMGEEARLHYAEHGWLAVRGLFDAQEIATAFAAVQDLIFGRVAGFRGVIYEASVRPRLAAMEPQERYDAVRKLFRFAAYEARLKAMSEQERLLAIVGNLLGWQAPGAVPGHGAAEAAADRPREALAPGSRLLRLQPGHEVSRRLDRARPGDAGEWLHAGARPRPSGRAAPALSPPRLPDLR